MTWVEAATLDDLPAGGLLGFASRGRAYVLFRSTDGATISCTDGLCPHNGGRLADGPFDGARVTCPRLGCLRWSFEVRGGACSAGEFVRVGSHSVRLEGRSIVVALPGD